MALTQQQKDAIFRRAMQRWSDERELCSFQKAALIAAIDAIDAWLDANQTEFNVSLPQPFRGAATTQQKGLLLLYAVMVMTGLRPEDF